MTTPSSLTKYAGNFPGNLRSLRLDPDPQGTSTGAAPTTTPTPPTAPTPPTGGGMLGESEVTRLRTLEKETQLLMRADTDPVRREQAARVVLKESGYTPEQIEEWVEQRRVAPSSRKGSAEEDDSQEPTELDEVREGLNRVSNDAMEIRVQNIKFMMDRSRADTMGSDSVVGKLLGDLRGVYGEKATEKIPQVTKYLEERIMKETIEELTVKKGRGKLDFAWIPSTMQQVAKRVTDEYRAVLPDLALIGRSGETDSGEEEFLKSAPVPAPVYKRGEGQGTGHQKVRSYVTDALSRLAAAGGEGTRA